jgi:hypothetical protein
MVGQLQESSRNFAGDLAFYRFAHDGRFLGAPGHQDDLARFKDGANAHGDGLGGHVLLAAEIARSIAARKVVQGHQPGARVRRRARLVKADVARTPNAQQLQVQPAQLLYLLFVVQAKGAQRPPAPGCRRGYALCFYRCRYG